MGKNKKKNRGN
jgi:hypothetical protein